MKKLLYLPKIVLLILVSVFSLNFTIGCNSSGNSNAAAIPAANNCKIEDEYQWPLKNREYWPTENWKSASMENHGIDPQKLNYAVNIYAASMGADAVLIIKDGYIVFEKYYVGDQNTSSELWSATKSFSSTLIGIAITMGHINNVNQLMREFMPEHDFGNISIYHVLTQSTGLNWSEAGSSWLQWVQSPDWVTNALSRESFATPGDFFLYSTANSHFLSHLITSSTGMATGDFANDYLFKPLGINFSRLPNPINYISWYNYYFSLGKTTWQQDVQGYEIGGMGLYLTAREMAKLGFLYINRGIWDGLRILSEDYIDEATKPYIADNYGYQWWISSQCYRYFFALGMGGQIIAIVPSLDMIVVIKCQPLNPENQNMRMYYMEQSIPMIIDSANRVE